MTKRRTKPANALARHRRTDYALGYFEAEKLVTGEITGTKVVATLILDGALRYVEFNVTGN